MQFVILNSLIYLVNIVVTTWVCLIMFCMLKALILNLFSLFLFLFFSQESVKTKHPQLLYESKLYKILQGGSNDSLSFLQSVDSFFFLLCLFWPLYCLWTLVIAGVPNVKWYGVEGDYNVLVIDLLVPSLGDLFNFCSRKLSLKSVLMLADQMVNIFVFLSCFSFTMLWFFFFSNNWIFLGLC